MNSLTIRMCDRCGSGFAVFSDQDFRQCYVCRNKHVPSEHYEQCKEQTENPKDRIGQNKPPLHLIPPSAEIAESMVMALGAAKYGQCNWRTSPVRASVYISAAKRHLAQWLDGQDNDQESGVTHLAHARACMGILIDAEATGNMIDDRPPAGAAAELIERHTKRAADAD